MISAQQAEPAAALEDYRTEVNEILRDRGHAPAWNEAIEAGFEKQHSPRRAADAIILIRGMTHLAQTVREAAA